MSYLWNAKISLVNPADPNAMGSAAAIASALAFLVVFWLLYDGICRVFGQKKNGDATVGAMVLVLVCIAAFLACHIFPGQAAFLLMGAMLATSMSANVFFWIIPGQRTVVKALKEGQPVDPIHGKRGKQRSVHNTYFTLPVLFIMISNHYAGTFSHPWNWLVLVLISVAGVGIRHWFNIRHLPGYKHWILPASTLLLVGLILVMRPQPMVMEAGETGFPTSESVMPLITERCAVCHSVNPAHPGFAVAPLGVVLDSKHSLEAMAPRVYQSVVVTRTMPLGNLTGMTEEERKLLARWYAGLETPD